MRRKQSDRRTVPASEIFMKGRFGYGTNNEDEALELLKKYNRDPFHIQHALTVEAVMRWFANELGYGDEADHWAIVGLLHDIDFELYPDEHCLKAPELLRQPVWAKISSAVWFRTDMGSRQAAERP